MSKLVHTGLLLVIIFYSCAPHKSTHSNGTSQLSLHQADAISSHFQEADTSFFSPSEITVGQTPVSMMELPRTPEGAFVVIPGFYEADFKTYCLQPGTPGPSARDAYFQVPLQGPRKELIESILLNSRKQAHLDQKNIQLLLWAVVSRSPLQKLTPEVQSAAWQLLTPKQVFELNGGVLGAVKTVTKILPSSGFQNGLEELFAVGTASYEAYERLAVLSSPSIISKPYMSRDQWYKHQDGYYVRYLPDSYKQTKIQVYVPGHAVDSIAREEEDIVVFDPTSLVIVPANSNAQRLGVGGAVKEVAGKVIDVIKARKERGSKAPKGGSNTPKVLNGGKTSPQAFNERRS